MLPLLHYADNVCVLQEERLVRRLCKVYTTSCTKTPVLCNTKQFLGKLPLYRKQTIAISYYPQKLKIIRKNEKRKLLDFKLL